MSTVELRGEEMKTHGRFEVAAGEEARFTLSSRLPTARASEAVRRSILTLKGSPTQRPVASRRRDSLAARAYRRLPQLGPALLPAVARPSSSAPVRVGNGAAGQLQLDVDGELIGALNLPRCAGLPASDPIHPESAPGASMRATAAREGVFLACRFWLVDNQVPQGRLAGLRSLFDRLLSYRDDFGLLADECDPVGQRQIGNFRQAFFPRADRQRPPARWRQFAGV